MNPPKQLIFHRTNPRSATPVKSNQSMLRPHSAGFSLIEVTLAIGILAFAFLSVFGLLSTSMNLARDSMDRTHLSRMTQRLVATVQQTAFAEQPTLLGTVFRFDGDGELLGTGGSGDYVYTATVLDQHSASQTNEDRLGIPSQTTRMLVVKIARNRLVTDGNIPADQLDQFSFAVADMAF